MSDRSLKKSLTDKSNHPADENLDLFAVNREASLDVLLKLGKELAKPEAHDVKKHGNDSLYNIFEVPLGTLSRLVLEARNTTLKPQSISTTRVGLRNETDPSSRPTRSGSTIRPSNIPTLRSSSAPRKTTTTTSASASVSSPKRTVSRSLTPVSRKTPSPSSTPSRISTTTSTTPSFKKAGDAQRSRSLTPRSKPDLAANSAPPSTKTNVRSASVSSRGCVRRDGCTSVSTTPQTPPRQKETVTLAFGRPVANVSSPKRNTSPDVTRTRPKGRSASPSQIPTFSGVTHTTATPKSVKPSAAVADSTRSGRRLSRASVQMAINHLDVTRNGKVGKNAYSSTMLYPHSIRSSSAGLRKQCGSSTEGSCSSSNHEEEDGRSLTKEGINTENKNDSARYDALLNVKDVKDTNWLLNIDDESHHSLIFDNAFDSPPDLFSPL
ncbi:PREDICTED: uncharacterized protein DDB_G0271670-like [Camelina sativa]|uniref:Uncharacterized protein DDB_G0271670-like n=1 Tax=Camelina sativa TaxID=90675 RepID=A0ABM0TI23_CAMSA|nr:PREDICTED: uncharacterized protein DDB_G0271670-like [Camelina sativa]